MRDWKRAENSAGATMRNKSAVSKIKSLKFRLMIIPMITMFLLGAILMFSLAAIYQKRLNSEYINKGVAVAKTMASLISGEDIDKYLSSLKKDAQYETTLRHLRDIQKINELKFLYVTRMTEDGQIFVFDTDPEAPVPLGDHITWADSLGGGHDDYTATLYRGERVEPLVAHTLNWGWVLSVYEPIYRADGTVAGFAGADVSMEQLLQERRYVFISFGVVIMLIFIIAAAINLFAAQRYVISPVGVLVEKAASFLPQTDTSDLTAKEANEYLYSNKVFKPKLRFRDELAILERSLFDMEQRVCLAISELKKAQESEHKASESKTVFLANMSHELRTPLNTILNMTQLIMDARRNPEDLSLLTQIFASSQELLTVINTILEISNIEHKELILTKTQMKMRDVFHDIDLITAQQCAVEKLRWFPETGTASGYTVIGDKMRLTQVLAILLRNTEKYAVDSGCVRFSARPFGETDENVSIFFEISCADSKMSFHESKELALLFDPDDETTLFDYKWVLFSVCRSLVQAMGGKIEVKNNAETGLVFSFAVEFEKAVIPEEPEEPEKSQPGASNNVNFSEKQIMIVDDVATNRIIVRHILEFTGARCIEAKDGVEALDFFLANAKEIDAILMDISMPRMDGYEATRKIRTGEATDRHVPIIALTAHTYPEDVEAAQNAGMDFHLGKPVDQELLIGTLKRFLRPI